MTKLSTNGMKLLKIIHLILIAMWTGSGLTVGIISWLGPVLMKSNIYSVYTILEIIDNYLMIPLVIGTLITGLAFSLLTNWGFKKHRWIAVKWVVVILQVPIGALLLAPLIRTNTSIAKMEQVISFNNPVFLQNQLMFHIANLIQFSLLIFLISISVLKPWKKSGNISK